MIKVEKNFDDVPSILKSPNREEAFNKNIISKIFSDGKTLYKPDEVKKRLRQIYGLKCAYCEKDISDEAQHVEHYRPKDIYYWLAFSWDNLLLCCGKCNTSKGARFKTIDDKVSYNNESFESIHNLGVSYDKLEKPMIINPEKDDVLDNIIFDREAKISSLDDRVQFTIDEACNLNRESLVQKRIKLVNTFLNSINKHYLFFEKEGYKGTSRFLPDIEILINECKKDNEFYSFRYFVLNNLEIFVENTKIQLILKFLIKKINTNNSRA